MRGGPRVWDSGVASAIFTLKQRGLNNLTFNKVDIVDSEVKERLDEERRGYEKYSAMLEFWKGNGYRL